jgi:hypothetical protein
MGSTGLDTGWALPLYALAGERECLPGEVEAAWLRYRWDDRQTYLWWLCSQLQRMGHRVSAPLQLDGPAGPGSREPDDHPDTTIAAVHGHVLDQDDPVVWCWALGSMISSERVEVSDGTIVTMLPSCRLWKWLPEQRTAIDDLLIIERGGWPRGTRVHTRGVPPYASSLGATAAEAGVHPTRTAISSPRWTLDTPGRTVAAGPPATYVLAYRARDTGASTYHTGQVPVQHLHLDLGPWHDPASQAGQPDPTVTIIAPAPSSTPPPASGPETSRRDAGADDRGDGGESEVRADQAAALLPATGPVTRHVPEDPQQRYRAAALTRLWDLRDRELRRAGDSTPKRIAERIAAGGGNYPEPPSPLNSRELAAADRAERSGRWQARWAPEAEPDQQLVTGRWREQLVQWLPEVTSFWSTPRQREALDGFTPDTTLTQIRTTLAAEGFVQVADLHRNGARPIGAGDVTAGTLDHPVPDPGDLGPGNVDLVLCHPTDALLASISTWDNGTGQATDPTVGIYFNAIALDRELFTLAVRADHVRDGDNRLTGICRGRIDSRPTTPNWSKSLRVQLAALRAFSRPVAPWRSAPHIHLGRDDSDQQVLHRTMIDQLPSWVHELLGIELRVQALRG